MGHESDDQEEYPLLKIQPNHICGLRSEFPQTIKLNSDSLKASDNLDHLLGLVRMQESHVPELFLYVAVGVRDQGLTPGAVIDFAIIFVRNPEAQCEWQ